MKRYHPTADQSATPLFRILSLGAGVQSSTLLLLSLEGEIEPFDAVIFADTGWETQDVYDHLEYLKDRCEVAGLPLHVVSSGNIREEAVGSDNGFVSMPLYHQRPDGTEGMGARQCTKNFKLDPIRHFIREMVNEKLGLEATTWRSIPNEVYVEQALGISVDEVRRARTPRARWTVFDYPLLELSWRRRDCENYLATLGVDAPSSACIGCPYRSDDMWRDLTDEEFADAVEFDKTVRAKAAQTEKFTPFVHRKMLPLDEVDLSTEEENGQINLFDSECEGMCGV